MCSAFLTLGFSSFIGFSPKFRCFIPQCDITREDADFNANYSVFAIPEWDCSEDSCLQDKQCKVYAYLDYDSKCSEDHFDNKTRIICNKHVYDKNEYENSFIADLDLAPSCESENDDWPFEVLT